MAAKRFQHAIRIDMQTTLAKSFNIQIPGILKGHRRDGKRVAARTRKKTAKAGNILPITFLFCL